MLGIKFIKYELYAFFVTEKKKKTIKQKRIFNSAYLETVRDFSSICRFPLRRHGQNAIFNK